MNRLKLIRPPYKAAMDRTARKWNDVAKPLHSLGLLEDAVIKIAGITGDTRINKRRVIVMCADNGVAAEGVTQTDSSVTALVAGEIVRGKSSVNLLAARFGADVKAADMGMLADVEGTIRKKINYGTDNIADGPAMSVPGAERAIAAGMDIVRECKDEGVNIIVAGEMGIGNTTTAAAVTSALLGISAADAVGRGAGLDDAGLKRKTDAVGRALKINKPDKDKPVELLSKLGGFDIAGMTGLFLGGAVYRVPVIIDGFISAAAAALAVKIAPESKNFMIASHVSGEKAGAALLEYIGLKPVITAGMFLGEGAGGIMLLPLIDGALSVYHGAHRFDGLPMERYKDL